MLPLRVWRNKVRCSWKTGAAYTTRARLPSRDATASSERCWSSLIEKRQTGGARPFARIRGGTRGPHSGRLAWMNRVQSKSRQLPRRPATEPFDGPPVPSKDDPRKGRVVAMNAKNPGIVYEKGMVNPNVSQHLARCPDVRVTSCKLVVQGCLVLPLLELSWFHRRQEIIRRQRMAPCVRVRRPGSFPPVTREAASRPSRGVGRRHEAADCLAELAAGVTAPVLCGQAGQPARADGGAVGHQRRPTARGAPERRTNLMYEGRSMKSAREGARLLSRPEPEAAPGAALAYRRVRAAGAAARTGKPIHCKRRAGSAQLCIRLCSRRRRALRQPRP